MLAGAVITAGVATMTPESVAQNPGSTRPNILIILTDDQAHASLDVMPFLRRWFQDEGMTLSNAYSTTPLCCPARASMLTGWYVHNHGLKDNYTSPRIRRMPTIQRYLHKAGYRTGIAGKFFNKWPATKPPPWFDRWTTFEKNGYRHARYNIDGNSRRVEEYSTTFLGEQAEDFLADFEGRDKDPWFLYIAPFAPHAPYVPESAYEEAEVPPWEHDPSVGEEDKSDKPPAVQARSSDLERTESRRAAQLRTLMSVDDMIESLATTMHELEEDNTLAFFLSDQGFIWGQHGLFGKRWPYTPALQVPFVVRWPGRIPAGMVNTRLAGNVDIAPTVLQAAGITPDVPMDGRSLLPNGSQERRTRLLLEYWSDPHVSRNVPNWKAIRSGRYQYTEYYDEDWNLTFSEYYDLEKDPYQLTNLLGDGDPSNDPADLDEIRKRLKRDRRCRGSRCP